MSSISSNPSMSPAIAPSNREFNDTHLRKNFIAPPVLGPACAQTDYMDSRVCIARQMQTFLPEANVQEPKQDHVPGLDGTTQQAKRRRTEPNDRPIPGSVSSSDKEAFLWKYAEDFGYITMKKLEIINTELSRKMHTAFNSLILNKELLYKATDTVKKNELAQWRNLRLIYDKRLEVYNYLFWYAQTPAATQVEREWPFKSPFAKEQYWTLGICSFFSLIEKHQNNNVLGRELKHSFIISAYKSLVELGNVQPRFTAFSSVRLGILARFRAELEAKVATAPMLCATCNPNDTHNIPCQHWLATAKGWFRKALDSHPENGETWKLLAKSSTDDPTSQLMYFSKALSTRQPCASARKIMFELLTDFSANKTRAATQGKKGLKKALAEVILKLREGADDTVQNECNEAFLQTLDVFIQTAGSAFREVGPVLAIVQIAAVLGFAATNSYLYLLVPQVECPEDEFDNDSSDTFEVNPIYLYNQASKLTYDTMARVLDLFNKAYPLDDTDLLPFLYVMLIFLRFLAGISVPPEGVNWNSLTATLARLPQEREIPEQFDAKPLPEDKMMHGLLWSVCAQDLNLKTSIARLSENQPGDANAVRFFKNQPMDVTKFSGMDWERTRRIWELVRFIKMPRN